MSYHIHINDEAGLWSCSGPYRTVESAVTQVEWIISRRQDGPWKRVKKSNYWQKPNSEHYIEIVEE